MHSQLAHQQNLYSLLTSMGTGDKFPWELLKAECLRLVCAQLIEASGEGQNALKLGRKEEMIAFLNNVYERGGKPKKKKSCWLNP